MSDATPTDAEPPEDDADHTKGGAPTDKAHGNAGDGSLTGAVPAGLSGDELREIANSGKTDDGGTG